MNVGEMFAGIGGFRLGLERAGHKIIWANEWDKYACQIYRKNFGDKELIEGDIHKVDPNNIPDIDILCGGFPCQSFSVAGKRQGFKDIRGTLFFEIARIAEIKRPKILLLENVKGLLSHDNGDTFETILRTLGNLGYWWEYQVLNSKYFGVPQNRERVFIIGHLRGESTRQIFPIRENINTSIVDRNKGIGLFCNALDSNYYKGPDGKRTMIDGELVQVIRNDSQAGRVYDPSGISQTLSSNAGGLGAKTGLYVVPVLTPDRSIKRQNGRRFKENGDEMFTLTAQDKHGVMIANCLDCDGYLRRGERDRDEKGNVMITPIANRRIRRLTPIECERLQGFPDGWTGSISDTQRYKTLGNAVTVNVIEYLGSLLTTSATIGEVK
jgi:DNA (cytosine-5)-methyltransferase 1